jgi:hypothetical protein
MADAGASPAAARPPRPPRPSLCPRPGRGEALPHSSCQWALSRLRRRITMMVAALNGPAGNTALPSSHPGTSDSASVLLPRHYTGGGRFRSAPRPMPLHRPTTPGGAHPTGINRTQPQAGCQ